MTIYKKNIRSAKLQPLKFFDQTYHDKNIISNILLEIFLKRKLMFTFEKIANRIERKN